MCQPSREADTCDLAPGSLWKEELLAQEKFDCLTAASSSSLETGALPDSEPIGMAGIRRSGANLANGSQLRCRWRPRAASRHHTGPRKPADSTKVGGFLAGTSTPFPLADQEGGGRSPPCTPAVIAVRFSLKLV